MEHDYAAMRAEIAKAIEYLKAEFAKLKAKSTGYEHRERKGQCRYAGEDGRSEGKSASG